MSTLKVNAIEEQTSGNGVDIDSSSGTPVSVKDGTVYADTIAEKTGAVGVTIDSLLVKDSALNFTADSKGTFKGISAIIWRMVNSESAGSQNPLGAGGADWEISDDTENEYYLGGAAQIIETSGIFSFAATGYYLIFAQATAQNAAAVENSAAFWLYSTDDNSTYSVISKASSPLNNLGYSKAIQIPGKIIKVSDISLDKVKLSQDGVHANTFFVGDGSNDVTYIGFIKLADL